MNQIPSIPWLENVGGGVANPAMLYAPAAIGLVAGLFLLLAGGKVLRPIAVLLGGAVGGMAGSILLPSFLPETLYGVPGGAVALGVGAVVGMVAAGVLFRAAMAAAGAVTFGAAGVLAAGIWLNGVPLEQPRTLAQTGAETEPLWAKSQMKGDEKSGVPELLSETSAKRLSLGVPGGARVLLASMQDSAKPGIDDSGAASVAGQLADRLWGDAVASWKSLPDENRLRIVISGLGAALVGLIIGALMPRRAAALVTALLGAGVFLVSLTWMARAADLPGRGLLDHGAMGWLMIWSVAAGAGLVFQLCGHPRTAKKPTPAAA